MNSFQFHFLSWRIRLRVHPKVCLRLYLLIFFSQKTFACTKNKQIKMISILKFKTNEKEKKISKWYHYLFWYLLWMIRLSFEQRFSSFSLFAVFSLSFQERRKTKEIKLKFKQNKKIYDYFLLLTWLHTRNQASWKLNLTQKHQFNAISFL